MVRFFPWVSSGRRIRGTIYRLSHRLHRAAVGAGILLAIASPAACPQEATPGPWADLLRQAGPGGLQPDALLSQAAGAHAEYLAARGEISHVGAGGSTVLERWRAVGGTSLRVGEIVGAGLTLAQIEEAWEASPSHRAVVLDPGWTHIGWASARRGAAVVYVVLFSRFSTKNLLSGWEDGWFTVRGSFTPPEAQTPVLFSGIRRVEPFSWDPVARAFAFRVASADFAPYLRLGYGTASGSLVLTDAFTPRADER